MKRREPGSSGLRQPSPRNAFKPGGGPYLGGPLSPMEFKRSSSRPLSKTSNNALAQSSRTSSHSRFGWTGRTWKDTTTLMPTSSSLKERTASKTILVDVENKTGWKTQDFLVPYAQLVKYRRVNEHDVERETWVDVTGKDDKPLRRNVGILR